MAYGFRAWTKIWGERVDESLEDLERALRLSPFDAWSAFYSAGMACVMTEANRLDEALAWSRQLVSEAPDWAPSYRRLAATYSRLGQLDEAQAATRRFLELDPDFTLRRFDRYSPYKGGPAYERFRDDLKRAGFSE